MIVPVGFSLTRVGAPESYSDDVVIIAQHEAYELVLRRLAWALAERRLQALLPTERLVWSDDFEGCVE